MHNVLEENYIWDLHIHTCECPKASGEFGKLKETFKEKTERVQEYVNRINNVFKNYPDLRMIAFTDHNRIDPDVREAFDNLKTNIVVLPGIEVDCAIKYDATTSGSPKHLIFYFDDEEFDYSSHAKLINNWLKDNCKPSEGVDFDSFLHFLCTKVKVSFLVSPHAIKQDKRGIVSELADEEKTTRNIDLYQGLFFCFWECASTSDIEKCKQFLEDFGRAGKVQAIHFSDSASCDKLKKYLDQPTQYFRALPSFRGLRMVGREASRISINKEKVDDSEKGNYFGEIKLKDGQTITLSPRLNTIIGGRGSGKSLLIDSIYYSKPDSENSKEKIDQKTKKRMKYAKENLGVSVKTMSSQPVTKDFNFNYLAQNAV